MIMCIFIYIVQWYDIDSPDDENNEKWRNGVGVDSKWRRNDDGAQLQMWTGCVAKEKCSPNSIKKAKSGCSHCFQHSQRPFSHCHHHYYRHVMVGFSSPWVKMHSWGGSKSSRRRWRLAALVFLFWSPVRFGQDDFYCFTVFTIFIDMFRSILWSSSSSG